MEDWPLCGAIALRLRQPPLRILQILAGVRARLYDGGLFCLMCRPLLPHGRGGEREREGEASSASAPVSRYCFEMLVEGVGLRWLTPDLV